MDAVAAGPGAELANKIARLVEEKGWNQEDFARISQLNRHTAVQGGLMADAAGQVLRDFFADRRAAQRAVREASAIPTEALPVPEVIESDYGALG